MKHLFYPLLMIVAYVITGCYTGNNMRNEPVSFQGDYFGQAIPGDSATLFAPNFISTGMNERDFTISPDGNEIFFCREAGNFKYTTIFYTKRVGNVWSTPEVFEYCTNPNYKYIEPHISPDGNKLFFISTMPVDSSSVGNEDIWISVKEDGEWTNPQNLGPPVNTSSKEFFPTVTLDGTIYYTHLDTIAKDEFIYRSRFKNGIYEQPEKLSLNVNIGKARYNAFVAPDESYIIIPAFGMTDSFGGTDYYITFRDSLDNWSEPVNMGPKINSANPKEWSASVTPDGKFIFFMSAKMKNNNLNVLSTKSLLDFHNSPQNGNTDIYWISSSIIEELRRSAK